MSGRRVAGPQQLRIEEALRDHFDDTDLAHLLLGLDEHYDAYTSRWQSHKTNVHLLVKAANRGGWLVRLLQQACMARPGDGLPFDELLRELTEVNRDHLMVLVAAVDPTGADIARIARERLAELAVTLRPWPGGEEMAAQQALDGSDVVVLIVTALAEMDRWACQYALKRATEAEADIVFLFTGPDRPADLPAGVHSIWISDDMAGGWEELKGHLEFLASPKGLLRALYARRDRLVTSPATAGALGSRVAMEIREIDARIAVQAQRDADPVATRRAADERVERGLELAKRPSQGDRRSSRIVTVNSPPQEPPAFRDRDEELIVVQRLLSTPAIRLITLTGRDGIGKTGFVSRLWNHLLGDDPRGLVDALVYLPVHGATPMSATALLNALVFAVDDAERHRLEAQVRLPVPLPDKVDEVLTALDGRTVVVIVDNAEDLLTDAGDLRDPDLGALIRRLVRHRRDPVHIVLVSQRTPTALLHDLPATAVRAEPVGGLDRDETHRLLCALDGENDFNFTQASDEQKDQLHQLTKGIPRAIELAFAWLRASHDRSLGWLLHVLGNRAEPDVVVFLFGEVFRDLGRDQRPVVEALAAYAEPVDAAAVDDLLRRYSDASTSQPVLESLYARRLIRRDGDRYYLPYQPDGRWVLDRLPDGGPDDRVPAPGQLSRLALLYLAAEHFLSARKPDHVVRHIGDLDAQFNEIRLRIRGGEPVRALRLIEELDDQYLQRWGYSEAVVLMLEKLTADLAVDRPRQTRRLSRLSDAYRQLERRDVAIDRARQALTLLPSLWKAAYHAALHGQWGAALLDLGKIPAATAHYRRALIWATVFSERYEAAKAHGGLLLCKGRAGRLRSALRHRDRAVKLARPGRVPDDPDSVGPHAELNAAWVFSQLGWHAAAWRALSTALNLAAEQRHRLLYGLGLVLKAQLLIDEGAFHDAIAVARHAAEIGTDSSNGPLCRSANEAITMACLGSADLEGAHRAVYVPGRSNGGVLGIGLRGIVAYRRGELDDARAAFAAAADQARERRLTEERDFQLLDWHGVALTGLAILDRAGRAGYLAAAQDAFGRARRLAPDAHGAVLRTMQLLNHLAVGADPALVEQIRLAANGIMAQ